MDISLYPVLFSSPPSGEAGDVYQYQHTKIERREGDNIDKMHLSQDGDFQNIYSFNRTS